MSIKIIISGGGTGGHIFPALSIARELEKQIPGIKLLFVGAKGGMEMSVVPRHGYEIKAVWISGIHRQLNLRNISRNLLFPFKLITSLTQASAILGRFKPDLVVGVGGFASAPLGRVAAGKGVPLVLCEQNAYPGLVNRWLAPKAQKILLGNGDASKYFDKNKTQVTGNPIREFGQMSKVEASEKLGLDPNKKIVLSLGGSLGAMRLNQAIQAQLSQIMEGDVQWIWQCGKRYYPSLSTQVPEHPNVRLQAFIDDMAAAYAAADLVISRAGASTISELVALSQPSILVPSPNVAEDHQTKNAMSLVDKGAALLVKDSEAVDELVPSALALLEDAARLEAMQTQIAATEKYNAAEVIVEVIKGLLRKAGKQV